MTEDRPLRRGPAWVLPVALGLVLLVCVLVRLHSSSVLWLDEALSIEISRRSLPDLLDALRRDGSPPLYYLLLHGWMAIFGESATATRALSTGFSLVALPVMFLAGRRIGGPQVAWGALLLLAANPFAVRYATETRMYALVQLLALLGVLAVLRALERPSYPRLLAVAVLSGCLALTHYWALFLLAATGLLLVVLALRDRTRPAPRRVLTALVAGGLLFAPWVPDFLFQVTRTGTPWAPVPSLSDLFRTLATWSGNGSPWAVALTLTLVGLLVLAVAGHRQRAAPGQPGGVRIGGPLHARTTALLAVGLGSVLLGLLTGIALGAGFAPRYSSVALAPVLLVAATGLLALPRKALAVVLAVVTVSGLVGVVGQPFSTTRTQAGLTAAAIDASLAPGDLVLYCPDQLGPAVSRRLPAGTDQLGYPLLDDPSLIDWVDYEQRNDAADPVRIAERLDARTDGAVFVVWAPGYRTYGRQCEIVLETLRLLRGVPTNLQRLRSGYGEQAIVERYPAPTDDRS